MRIAYFTAGSIGAGHHVRGLAVGRGLARASSDITYRTFGPRLPYPALERFAHTAVTIERATLEDPARARESSVAEALLAYSPDLVIVDMFWAALFHVLPLLGCESWLLIRKCPALWFGGPSRGLQFDSSRFARIFAIEPNLGSGPWTEEIDPIVVANPSECRPRGALREHVSVPEGARLHVALHAGRPGERSELEQGASGQVVLDLFDNASLFPAAEWLGGADRISSGAGYNSFWEAIWLGYADRTVFTPFVRPIDDQAWRIRACRGHVMRENGADALARAIVQRHRTRV